MNELSSKVTRLISHVLGLGFLLIPISCTSYLNDNYTPTKWAVVYALSLMALLCSLFNKSAAFKLPKLGWGAPLLFSLGFFYLLGMVLHAPGPFENSILDTITLVSITFISFNLFSKNSGILLVLLRYNFFATLLVVAYSFCQMGGFELFESLRHNEFPVSFFGFQNMTAEFLGLSILMQIAHVYFKQRLEGGHKQIKKLILIAVPLLVLSFSLLLILKSRAAILSLGLGLVPLAFMGWPVKLKKFAFAGVVLLALGGLSYAVRLELRSANSNDPLDAIKRTNSSIRLIRWQNTLELIKDHPFGVGPGNFEFSYLSYRDRHGLDPEASETMIAKSPHNGYLQALSDSGILYTIILLLSIGWLAALNMSKSKGPFDISKALPLGILIFILVDAGVAFPMENAYPFFVMAVFLGQMISVFEPVANSDRGAQALLGVLSLITLYLGPAFVFSKWIEANEPEDRTLNDIACGLFTSNWRTCLNLAQIDLKMHHPLEAEKTLQSVLKRSPNHFVALKLLSFASFEQKKPGLACVALSKYDFLFSNSSSMHKAYIDLCNGSPNSH